MSQYVYDAAWEQERERLAGIEALWDPGTQALLRGIGLAPGWRCLEVGAGGGAIVDWLCSEVGPSGQVVATDIDTRFIDRLELDQLDARRHDVTADELPRDGFDLVHSRLVLEHLAERDAVLDKLVAAARPGGWVVIEDYDWRSFGIEPADEDTQRSAEAILAFMAQAGFEAEYGRRVTSELAARALSDVRGEGRLRVIDASHPGYAFFELSFAALKEAVVQSGRLTQEEADATSTRLEQPDARVITPVLVAAAGRNP